VRSAGVGNGAAGVRFGLIYKKIKIHRDYETHTRI
jgi:hypothetical protein